MQTDTKGTDYEYLRYSWKLQWSQSRKLKVLQTKFQCHVPPITFYLHRAGLKTSPLCPLCEETETNEQYFILCQNYSLNRKRLLVIPFSTVDLNLTEDNVVSFGASGLVNCHRMYQMQYATLFRNLNACQYACHVNPCHVCFNILLTNTSGIIGNVKKFRSCIRFWLGGINCPVSSKFQSFCMVFAFIFSFDSFVFFYFYFSRNNLQFIFCTFQ